MSEGQQSEVESDRHWISVERTAYGPDGRTGFFCEHLQLASDGPLAFVASGDEGRVGIAFLAEPLKLRVAMPPERAEQLARQLLEAAASARAANPPE